MEKTKEDSQKKLWVEKLWGDAIYSNIEETLCLISHNLNNEGITHKNPKTFLETRIRDGIVSPFFYYEGYALRHELEKNGDEYITICTIAGFFKDISLDDQNAYFNSTFCDISAKAYNVTRVTAKHIQDFNEIKIYPIGKTGKVDHVNEPNFGRPDIKYNDIIVLLNKLPIINSDDFVYQEDASVKIDKTQVYFFDDQINALFKANRTYTHKSRDDLIKEDLLNRSLISYLDINQAVEYLQNRYYSAFTKTNLIDAIHQKHIMPVIYFDGEAESMTSKERAKYPDDWLSDTYLFSSLRSYKNIFDSYHDSEWQENFVHGYFQLLDTYEVFKTKKTSNRFIAHHVTGQQATNNKHFDFSRYGYSSNHDIFLRTPILNGDFVKLYDYGKIPTSSDTDDGMFAHEIVETDLRFSTFDLSELVEKMHPIDQDNDNNTRNQTEDIENLTAQLDQANATIADLHKQLAEAKQGTHKQADNEVTGIALRNQTAQNSAKIAKTIAGYLWGMDSNNKIKKKDMVMQIKGLVYGITDYIPDTDDTIMSWIDDVAPDYAKKGGRPPKDEKDIILTMKK